VRRQRYRALPLQPRVEGWLELQWYFNSAVFLLIAANALNLAEHVRIASSR